VFFALCASGAFSFPVFMILHLLGYRGTQLNDTIGWAVALLAMIELFFLPAASFLFYKVEPTLAWLGFVGFFFALCGAMFPALG
jgi:hypothetical protein